MRALLVLLALTCAHAASLQYVLPGEGDTRVLPTKKSRASQTLFRFDTALDGPRTCGEFWAASTRGQAERPASAYRRANRGMLNGLVLRGIKQGNLPAGTGQVKRVSVRCVMPNKRFKSDLKLIRVESVFPKLTDADVEYLLPSYSRAVGFCRLTNMIVNKGGAAWKPLYFNYRYPNVPAIPTRAVFCTDEDCHEFPWNPTRIEFVDLGCDDKET